MDNQPQQKKPELPEGTYAITKQDKEVIRNFGRELNKFIMDYARRNARGPGLFPIKIVFGGFDYFQQIHQQRARTVADDLLMTIDEFESKNLHDSIFEPFADEPEVETPVDTPEVAAPVTEQDKVAEEVAEAIPSPVDLSRPEEDGPQVA